MIMSRVTEERFISQQFSVYCWKVNNFKYKKGLDTEQGQPEIQ